MLSIRCILDFNFQLCLFDSVIESLYVVWLVHRHYCCSDLLYNKKVGSAMHPRPITLRIEIHVMVGAGKNNARHKMYIFTIAACISPEVALGYNFHNMACCGFTFYQRLFVILTELSFLTR